MLPPRPSHFCLRKPAHPTVTPGERICLIYLLTVDLVVEIDGRRFLEREGASPYRNVANLVVVRPSRAEQPANRITCGANCDGPRIGSGIAPDVRRIGGHWINYDIGVAAIAPMPPLRDGSTLGSRAVNHASQTAVTGVAL